MISGKLNKPVGFDLGISVQTTKIHRHRVFKKMQADSLVELAQMADQLRVSPAPAAR
jgi:FixJ family two-component response regulator